MGGNIYWTEQEVNTKLERYQKEADHKHLVDLALEARPSHHPNLLRRFVTGVTTLRRPDPCAQSATMASALAQEPC